MGSSQVFRWLRVILYISVNIGLPITSDSQLQPPFLYSLDFYVAVGPERLLGVVYQYTEGSRS